ncbi:hypothetical protein GCM10011513_05960 [Franconibacter daqui]|nr:hypothetical protein GCM10011513_05960 [Franconibacter daqui]
MWPRFFKWLYSASFDLLCFAQAVTQSSNYKILNEKILTKLDLLLEGAERID